MKTFLLFSIVPLAFIAPFVATTLVLALITTHVYAIRHQIVEEKLMQKAHEAEARRKAKLGIAH